MTTLHDLAVKYNSDKLYFHSYIPMYERIFSGMDVRRLLEIGIGYRDLMWELVPEYTHGSSLLMWHDYFPDVGVFACDIREDTLINDDEKRIWSTVCDQSKPADLWKLIEWSGGEFDIIIDDGSHQHEHQLLAASVLLPQLRKGGVYIVEDVWPDKGAELAKTLGGELWRGEKRPNGDDNLVVVRKGKPWTSY